MRRAYPTYRVERLFSSANKEVVLSALSFAAVGSFHLALILRRITLRLSQRQFLLVLLRTHPPPISCLCRPTSNDLFGFFFLVGRDSLW